MDLIDRAVLMLLGGAIGFVLGYIVRGLREIKEELDEVDELLNGEISKKRRENEGGFMRQPIVHDLAFLLVLAIVVWAAFSSNEAATQAEENQEALALVTQCNQEFLSKTIVALNERTEFTQAQAEANVELQTAQAEYLSTFFKRPPPNTVERVDALRTYFDALTDFVKISAKTDLKVDQNPYPTNKDLSYCLNGVDRD